MFGGCGSTLGSLSLRFSTFTQIDQSDRMYEQLQWRGASLLEGVQESLPGLTSLTLRQRVFRYGLMTLADADFIVMSRCLLTCPGTVAPVDLAASLLTPLLILDWISNAPEQIKSRFTYHNMHCCAAPCDTCSAYKQTTAFLWSLFWSLLWSSNLIYSVALPVDV